MEQGSKRTNTPDDRDLGAKLKLARLAAGLSQTQIGKALGVSFQQVQKYERGVNRLSAVNLRHVSALLGVSPSDLLPTCAQSRFSDRTSSATPADPLSEEIASLVDAFRQITSARSRRAVLAIALEFGRSDSETQSAINDPGSDADAATDQASGR